MSSAIPHDALSQLFLSVLKHDLRRHKQSSTAEQEERDATPAPEQLLPHVLNPFGTDGKPNEVSRHHQQDVEDASASTQMSIPPCLSELGRRDQSLAEEFWDDE